MARIISKRRCPLGKRCKMSGSFNRARLVPRSKKMNNKNGVPLRSTHWFGLQDKDGFIHRSWMKNQGFPSNLFDGRPVIGICNTWSELVPCNAHFRMIAERVKRGVYE